ncbi:MAG: hypothetical protein R3Y24_14100 [Eubacteriales bacterium]
MFENIKESIKTQVETKINPINPYWETRKVSFVVEKYDLLKEYIYKFYNSEDEKVKEDIFKDLIGDDTEHIIKTLRFATEDNVCDKLESSGILISEELNTSFKDMETNLDLIESDLKDSYQVRHCMNDFHYHRNVLVGIERDVGDMTHEELKDVIVGFW